MNKWGVLASCCCANNKWSQMEWLKTMQIYSPTVLDVRCLKSRCWQGYIPSEGFGRNHSSPLPVLLLLLLLSHFSRVWLCATPVDVVFIPWLVVPHYIALHSLGFHLPVTSLPSEHQLPSYKNPCDYTGSAWIIWVNSLPQGQLKNNFKSICNLSFLLPYNIFINSGDVDVDLFGESVCLL